MTKVLPLVAALLLTLGLVAQTPRATFEYVGKGCGWFQHSFQDIVCTFPPVVGQYVEFNTSIPTYGTDFMQFGAFDPNFPIGHPTPTSGLCRVHAYSFPAPHRTWLSWVGGVVRFIIPNDPALVGRSVFAQQLNYNNGDRWETSRGVKLTFGY
jgi:hypothetical protein